MGGSVYVWNLNKQQANVLYGHKAQVTSITFDEYSNLIATSSHDSNVKIWDLRASNNQAVYTYTGHDDIVKDVSISPDGKWVGSGGADGDLKIWEITTGKSITNIP